MDQRRLKKVTVDSSVISSCLSHALRSDHEEVMSLLIGRVEPDPSHPDMLQTIVEGTVLIPRAEHRPDRVEIAALDLIQATSYAESLGMRVIGWFHSHPRITPVPSQFSAPSPIIINSHTTHNTQHTTCSCAHPVY
jgi:BRCA1/BRCA2-containing complex subunit 3